MRLRGFSWHGFQSYSASGEQSLGKLRGAGGEQLCRNG